MKKPIHYWDSVIWLGILKKEENKVDVCLQLLKRAENGEIRIVISSITLTEVVHLGGENRLTPQAESDIQSFFEHSFIAVRAVDRRTAEFARELMWRFNSQGLRPKDAIHAATASLSNVDELNTYDDDLLSLDGKIRRSDGKPLRILKPFVEQLPLFPIVEIKDTEGDGSLN